MSMLRRTTVEPRSMRRLHPLAQLGLGRAYAMQGERDKSRKAYDDFFITWKDADANIPILRQAKTEYKSLIATGAASVSGEQQ